MVQTVSCTMCYPISTSAGIFNSRFKRRIIERLRPRLRLRTSYTRFKLPIYGCMSLADIGHWPFRNSEAGEHTDKTLPCPGAFNRSSSVPQ